MHSGHTEEEERWASKPLNIVETDFRKVQRKDPVQSLLNFEANTNR
jgi:hypothetical protein